MSSFFGEFFGTMIMIILGNGVVANVVLRRTKAEGGGWMVITSGWTFAVIIGIFCAIAAGSKLSRKTLGSIKPGRGHGVLPVHIRIDEVGWDLHIHSTGRLQQGNAAVPLLPGDVGGGCQTRLVPTWPSASPLSR